MTGLLQTQRDVALGAGSLWGRAPAALRECHTLKMGTRRDSYQNGIQQGLVLAPSTLIWQCLCLVMETTPFTAVVPGVQLALNVFGEVMEDGPNTSAPDTPVKERDGAPGSWLCGHLASDSEDALCLSVATSFKQTNIRLLTKVDLSYLLLPTSVRDTVLRV